MPDRQHLRVIRLDARPSASQQIYYNKYNRDDEYKVNQTAADV
jgi:hypothetical protein